MAAATDEELVGFVRSAQRSGARSAAFDAYEHLCARHDRRVRVMLLSKVPDGVDDLAQEVRIAAFQGVVGDREIQNFKAWLVRIVRNTIADVWRGREGREIEHAREAARRNPDGAPEPAFAGEYGEWETWQVIDGLLAELSAQHREVVELYVIDDLGASETSRRTGESADNVYQIAKRFRTELRSRLAAGPDDNERT